MRLISLQTINFREMSSQKRKWKQTLIVSILASYTANIREFKELIGINQGLRKTTPCQIRKAKSTGLRHEQFDLEEICYRRDPLYLALFLKEKFSGKKYACLFFILEKHAFPFIAVSSSVGIYSILKFEWRFKSSLGTNRPASESLMNNLENYESLENTKLTAKGAFKTFK